MRVLLVLIFGATAAVAQGRGLEYVGGPHVYSTLDRPGDGYVAMARGVTPLGTSSDLPRSRDVQIAFALTKRLAIIAREYKADHQVAGTSEPRWYDHSAREAGIARLSTIGPGRWRRQDQLTYGIGTSDMAIRSFDGDDGPLNRAEGRYWRLAYQSSGVLRREYAEIGIAGRVSAVHFTRFHRRQRDNTAGALPDPYTVAMDTPGSRTGVVLEPGFMARVGLRYFKVGPDISLAYPLPGMKTAYDVQRIVFGLSGAINFQPRGMR
jgi:hypothetical protein